MCSFPWIHILIEYRYKSFETFLISQVSKHPTSCVTLLISKCPLCFNELSRWNISLATLLVFWMVIAILRNNASVFITAVRNWGTAGDSSWIFILWNLRYSGTGKVHECNYFANTQTGIALANLTHSKKERGRYQRDEAERGGGGGNYHTIMYMRHRIRRRIACVQYFNQI